MRRFKLFRLRDDTEKPYLLVDAIHDRQGYRDIRRSVAQFYDPGNFYADIEVVDVDLSGDRCLKLRHRTSPGHLLDEKDARASLTQLADLWGYDVKLLETDRQTDKILATHLASPPAI
jgi:stage V sporulation protein R